jgi:hypothetical protein
MVVMWCSCSNSGGQRRRKEKAGQGNRDPESESDLILRLACGGGQRGGEVEEGIERKADGT